MTDLSSSPPTSFGRQRLEWLHCALLDSDRIRSWLDLLKHVCDAELIESIEDAIMLAKLLTQEVLALSCESGADRIDAWLLLAPYSNPTRERRNRVRHSLNQLSGAQDILLIESTVVLAREAFALSSESGADRIDACLLLAASLSRRMSLHADDSLLDEIIDLEREALDLRPEGHPDRAQSCGNLAVSLKTRHKHTGHVCLLDEAIDLERESLDLRPEGHPERTLSCGNLAQSLRTRYKGAGDVRLLDEAIGLERESLGLRPEGHPDRALSCAYLAISLRMYYERIGDVCLLDEAIRLEREVLDLRPEGHPDRAISYRNLATSLYLSYARTSDLLLLDEAINLERESLDLCPEGHPDRALSCGNLAVSLTMRYKGTGDVRLLDEAIDLERESLGLRPEGHPERALSCRNLADSLRTRYKSTGDVRLLDEAIDLERESLGLRPEGHLERAKYCINLAFSLMTLYGRTGDICLLDEAIDLEREALDLCPEGHPDRAPSCGNLADSLRTRYKRTGDVRLLDKAIDLEREALNLRPEGHPDRALYCLNLADSLRARYKRTGDVRLLDEAIDLERESLGLRPEGHPERAISCWNLAESLRTRYQRTDDVHLMNQAIDLDREALDLRPEGHPDRSFSCISLAHSLWMRYSCTGDACLLDEVINLERESLNLLPEGHPERAFSCGNLAVSLTMRYKRTGDEALLHAVLALKQEAVTIGPVRTAWLHLTSLAWVYLEVTSPFYSVSTAITYLSQALENDLDDICTAVKAMTDLVHKVWSCHAEGMHTRLTTVYRRLVNLMPLLAHPALDLQPQLQAMKGCARLGSDAFVNATLAGNCSSGLEALELAQSVIWSQSLHRRDPQLQDVPESLANRLHELLHAIAMNSAVNAQHNSKAAAHTKHDMLHANSSRMYALVREIRALPGLDRFMLGETFETLCTVASQHPVVVLVSARGQHYALIMAKSLAQRHMLISLDLSEDDLASLSFMYASMGAHRSAAVPEEAPEVDRAGLKKTADASSGPLDGQLRTLWHKIVKPVLDHLGLKPSRGYARPRLHWCSTGIFSNFPLHAAGAYGGSHKICCSDFVVSTYTPTITALLRVQRTTMFLKRDDVSLVLVAEKRALQRNLETIPGVDKEIDLVTAVANQSNIKDIHQSVGSTTVSGTSALIQTTNIVHLACHGVQDVRDATQSGFCLGDGRLTITGLMELKLDSAFLAFLSACETAKGDKEQPDQAMHLAAAMLFSGFKSVIATMWVIRDYDGPRVAKWFYEELFSKEKINADSVAYALDSAVGKLRASGVSPARWAPFIHVGA